MTGYMMDLLLHLLFASLTFAVPLLLGLVVGLYFFTVDIGQSTLLTAVTNIEQLSIK